MKTLSPLEFTLKTVKLLKKKKKKNTYQKEWVEVKTKSKGKGIRSCEKSN